MTALGAHPATIGLADDGWSVTILDQTALPHGVVVRRITTCGAMAEAIRTMRVRGAPLIGAAAAYGLCLALRDDASDAALQRSAADLRGTRPTAVNLDAALERVLGAVRPLPPDVRAAAAYREAAAICDEDRAINRAIGEQGLPLIRTLADRDGTAHVLTHCNAGYLATVDWGTALAPVYRAHADGLAVHVWVSETRPRGQGALTAWELGRAGVPHTIVADNAAGHLLQRGRVGICLVGTDRTTASGDVTNKIGTYLKAVAAGDTGVPFYACVPSPSIDWGIGSADGIPIEERDAEEVRLAAGQLDDGRTGTVRLVPASSPAANPAFDVTPARLLTGLITERGICAASREGLAALFPERRLA